MKSLRYNYIFKYAGFLKIQKIGKQSLFLLSLSDQQPLSLLPPIGMNDG